mgnify:CR=1 FL=1
MTRLGISGSRSAELSHWPPVLPTGGLFAPALAGLLPWTTGRSTGRSAPQLEPLPGPPDGAPCLPPFTGLSTGPTGLRGGGEDQAKESPYLLRGRGQGIGRYQLLLAMFPIWNGDAVSRACSLGDW